MCEEVDTPLVLRDGLGLCGRFNEGDVEEAVDFSAIELSLLTSVSDSESIISRTRSLVLALSRSRSFELDPPDPID